MHKLDEIALNIELVLISIIEAVALTFLAESALPLLRDTTTLQYLPYILSGLVLLLVFWSQAILHAVSFIRWPLRMEHMLFYFLAAFLQVVAYSHMTDLAGWFFWWTIFSVLVAIIYVIDLHVINDTVSSFASLPGGQTYMGEVKRRHIYELKYLVPLSIAFNVLAWALVFFIPSLFENSWVYIIPGVLQLAISVGALKDCLINFKNRSRMLPGLFK